MGMQPSDEHLEIEEFDGNGAHHCQRLSSHGQSKLVIIIKNALKMKSIQTI